MGNTFGKKETLSNVILLQGLSGSGKTSLVYKAGRGEEVPEGLSYYSDTFNETLELAGTSVVTTDVNGRDKHRPGLDIHYWHSGAFVFLLDGTDKERLEEALDELIELLVVEHTWGKPILVLINKTDVECAMTVEEVRKALIATKHTFSRHPVLVRACSVLQNTGLQEALTDLTRLLLLMQSGSEKKTPTGILDRVPWEKTESQGKEKVKRTGWSLSLTQGLKTLLQPPASCIGRR